MQNYSSNPSNANKYPQNHKRGCLDFMKSQIWGGVGAIATIAALFVALISIPQAAPAREFLSHTLSETPTLVPTPTFAPTPTPSPTPTPKIIPINQTMSCTNCSIYTFSLMVRSATIDPAKSQVVLLIGLQNTSKYTLNESFSFLKLQDLQTGLTTNGAGDGFDLTQITANQLILFRPTFPFIPVSGREYSFSASLSTNGYAFSPITIKF